MTILTSTQKLCLITHISVLIMACLERAVQKQNCLLCLMEEIIISPCITKRSPTIITRWRKHSIAFAADLEKIFRQINVSPEHQYFQWRNAANEIYVYALRTVTYGTTSAHYVAIGVQQQLAEDEKQTFKKLVKYFEHTLTWMTWYQKQIPYKRILSYNNNFLHF